ncbi:hypothetical protein NIES4073_06430 [Kalymmatonema gypsitolerans NIES-4073]|nr:hypothetical protein NIES4073_06430 [Scytonema sp. NIES-4073]
MYPTLNQRLQCGSYSSPKPPHIDKVSYQVKRSPDRIFYQSFGKIPDACQLVVILDFIKLGTYSLYILPHQPFRAADFTGLVT